MQTIDIVASDGHKLSAYRVDPDGDPRGGVVVVQEIFGVNRHIRSICDRLAALGYSAIAPALFDRTERDFQSGYSDDELVHARSFMSNPDWNAYMRDVEAARENVAEAGKVGVLGFCLGGVVAFLAATRLDGIAATSGFYGGRINTFADETPKCPVQLHYGSEDHGISMENVNSVRERREGDCEIHIYAGVGHGFHCDERDFPNDPRGSFDPAASAIAWGRTIELFGKHIA